MRVTWCHAPNPLFQVLVSNDVISGSTWGNYGSLGDRCVLLGWL